MWVVAARHVESKARAVIPGYMPLLSKWFMNFMELLCKICKVQNKELLPDNSTLCSYCQTGKPITFSVCSELHNPTKRSELSELRLEQSSGIFARNGKPGLETKLHGM